MRMEGDRPREYWDVPLSKRAILVPEAGPAQVTLEVRRFNLRKWDFRTERAEYEEAIA